MGTNKKVLAALRDNLKKMLLEAVVVDKFVGGCKNNNNTKNNKLFQAGVTVLTNRLEVRRSKEVLQNKTKDLRKDLSQLEAVKSKKKQKPKTAGRIRKEIQHQHKDIVIKALHNRRLICSIGSEIQGEKIQIQATQNILE